MKLPFRLLLLVLMLGLPATSSTAAEGQDEFDYAQAKAASICTPIGVASFGNRIHVRCSTPISGITFFAVPTAEPNKAARILALWSSALAAGRDVRIHYDPADTSGTAIGCLASDCRLADATELL